MGELAGWLRLIPARAGNTNGLRFPGLRGAAHPRSRGEHMLVDQINAAGDGSSPLARGTQANAVKFKSVMRLIPARAGNTLLAFLVEPRHSAHPRSRGEHSSRIGSPRWRTGSSPLARGTPGTTGAGRLTQRLIPARAGNTIYTSMF